MERNKTTLEMIEDSAYNEIELSADTQSVQDALTELGFAHLAMEPAKFRQAINEIWASMHGRSGMENLGILARFTAQVSEGYGNPLTTEYHQNKTSE